MLFKEKLKEDFTVDENQINKSSFTQVGESTKNASREIITPFTEWDEEDSPMGCSCYSGCDGTCRRFQY